MNNIKLTLSYDGTDYNGFQSQPDGNTIEDILKQAISKITAKKTKIYCAGRTDSGVHAEGQVINFFSTKKNISEKNWKNALNSLLPDDIRIMKCNFMPDDFHSRKSCKSREYHYKIINSPVISALKTRYTAYHKYPLNIKLLKKYSKILTGEHDFTSFCASGDMSESKIRHIDYIKIIKKGSLITFKIKGNAFLQHMIRTIIGTFLMLHKKESPASELKKILEKKNRQLAGPKYSPKGLIFYRVNY